jgi:hypothetical protein
MIGATLLSDKMRVYFGSDFTTTKPMKYKMPILLGVFALIKAGASLWLARVEVRCIESMAELDPQHCLVPVHM